MPAQSFTLNISPFEDTNFHGFQSVNNCFILAISLLSQYLIGILSDWMTYLCLLSFFRVVLNHAQATGSFGGDML